MKKTMKKKLSERKSKEFTDYLTDEETRSLLIESIQHHFLQTDYKFIVDIIHKQAVKIVDEIPLEKQREIMNKVLQNGKKHLDKKYEKQQKDTRRCEICLRSQMSCKHIKIIKYENEPAECIVWACRRYRISLKGQYILVKDKI